MTWGDLQPFATALAGCAAVAAFVLTVLRERHPLTAIERLTSVADKIGPGAARRVVEDYRDERIIRWVLEQRAPADVALRWLGTWLRISASFAFFLWLFGVILVPSNAWIWLAYGLAIALFIGGNAVLSWRRNRRQSWMDQELLWRGIALPAKSTGVREVMPS